LKINVEDEKALNEESLFHQMMKEINPEIASDEEEEEIIQKKQE